MLSAIAPYELVTAKIKRGYFNNFKKYIAIT